MKKRFAATLSLVCALAIAFTACAQGEDFPTREINIVVGSGAGGGLDNFSRAIAKPMSDSLGVPVIVTNVSGGGGSVALDQIMAQDADGHTMFAISTDIILSDLFKKSEYTRKNLIPVIRAQMDQAVFWVSKDSKFQTMKDVVDFAKANPGKLNFGQVHAAAIDAVIIANWANAADVEVTQVPFDSGSDLMAGLIGGHVDIAHEEPGSAIGMYDAGLIRPVLVMTEERLARLDAPTAREMGWDLTLGNWRGLFVKEGTPAPIVTKLHDTVKAALEDEAYKKIAHDTLLDLRPGYQNSADFKAFIEDQFVVFQDILSGLGMIEK